MSEVASVKASFSEWLDAVRAPMLIRYSAFSTRGSVTRALFRNSTVNCTSSDVSTPDPVPEDFVARVNALAYSPKYLVEHEWQDGDIVMVDNYSVLHGRRAMSRDSAARELWRVQVY